jgi:hypothetical protein
METEQGWHHHAIQKGRESAHSRLHKQRASIVWQKHPCCTIQAEMNQAGGRHNLGAQPDGVDPDVGQVEKWSREVAADERLPRPRLWIESSDVRIKEHQRHPTSAQMARSATTSYVKSPRTYVASLVAAPGR